MTSTVYRSTSGQQPLLEVSLDPADPQHLAVRVLEQEWASHEDCLRFVRVVLDRVAPRAIASDLEGIAPEMKNLLESLDALGRLYRSEGFWHLAPAPSESPRTGE